MTARMKLPDIEEKDKPKRRPIPDHIPRMEVELTPGTDACADCGGSARMVRHEPATGLKAVPNEELEYVPGRFTANRIVRPRLTCACCERFMQAPLPSRPIERGRPGPGLLAHVLVSKYADHLPLYAEIEAPRVCGLVGNSGRVVDSIGLRYRDLADGGSVPERWRNFLVLLEPYLFPMNVPSQIDLSVRGILLAGKWRTADDLDTMSSEDKRNTLIAELGGHSNQDGPYFWGMDDAALAQKGAVVVFLLTTGLRDRKWLQAHSCAEHRAAVVQLIHNARDEPHKTLEGLSEGELVRWGFVIKPKAAAAARA